MDMNERQKCVLTYVRVKKLNLSLSMHIHVLLQLQLDYEIRSIDKGGGPSRWRSSKTWRSSSSPQIYQKYVYTWNNSYRTPTERW